MALTSSQKSQQTLINASPTKEFFIHMLTRDILISRAIIDLVDNSVDGARRLRPTGNYDGLWVRIELDAKHFRIADNCGGIPVDVARDYAFRFGRPKEAQGTPGSMGQFGVGMKRTFFRLGRHFVVRSTTEDSRFTVDVDVDEWLADGESPENWHFKFSALETGLHIKKKDTGTIIEVNRLLPNVMDTFTLENFKSRLVAELSHAHALILDREFSITLNGIPIKHDPQQLFTSREIKPGYVEKSYPSEVLVGKPGPPVRVKLYAGVSERSLHDGGWYIFCNGRLILRADQTDSTVWNERHQMPAYRPDFAYFRGYAYFDCDDGALLPWTTTKTGVDVDSPIYKAVQREMIEMTRPVLAFLTNLVKEKSAAVAVRPLERSITTASATQVQTITKPHPFVAPLPTPAPAGPKMQKIQYSKPVAEVEKARQLLKVKSFTTVGEKTFEYFMRYEAGEDE
ncbi:MAG: ATP-binding protein [Deltaproteobacteria bacterium]|nr:ATP-binding protein [Deltaproteobacteria bacterium]